MLEHFDWTPGLADTSWVGWTTLAAYLAVAGLCFVAARQGSPRLDRRRIVWLTLGVVLLVVAFGKASNTQMIPMVLLKSIAISNGWYEDGRKLFQLGFFIVVLSLAWVLIAAGFRWLGRASAEFRFVILGLLALSAFVAIRATSLGELEDMLFVWYGPLRLHSWLELGALATCALGIFAGRASAPAPRDSIA